MLCTPLAIALALALQSPTADAKDQAQTETLAAVVSVASRAEQPLREVAGTVSLIEAERLEQTLTADLSDALRYEPGVSVPRDSVRFGAAGISMRGLSGNRVGMLVDDVPVGEGFAVGSFSNADRGSLETAFLSRIELMRGPASSLYGSDALAGVVSLRTFRATDLLADAEGASATRSQMLAGSRDSSLQSSIISAWQLGRFDLLAGVVQRRGSERDTNPRPGGLSANPADVSGNGQLLKLGLDSGWGGRYELALERSSERHRSELNSFVNGPRQYATTTAMSGNDTLLRERWSLQASYPLTVPGLDQLQFSAWQAHARSEQRTLQTRRAAPPRTPHSLRDRSFVYKDQSAGISVRGEGRFNIGSRAHWQVFGVDLRRTDINDLRDALQTNLDTGAVTNVIIGESFPVRDFPPTRSDHLGLYWQDEIVLGNSSLSLIPGLRHDRVSIDARPDSLFNDDNPGFSAADLETGRTTARLGMRWELNSNWQLYGQFAQGFRAPSAADLNIGFTIPAFNYVALPNPNLRPERSQGVELGLRWNGPRGSAELVGFHNQYKDLIDSRVNLGRDPDSGALVFQSINRSSAKIQGIELRGELALPHPNYSVIGSLAWAHGTDTADGVPLNSVEPGRLVAGLVYQSDDGRHRLELSATAVQGKRRVDDADGALFVSPGYVVVDAYWRLQTSERVALNVGVFNIADRRYWQWSSVAGIESNARELDLYTAPGRNIGAAIHYRW